MGKALNAIRQWFVQLWFAHHNAKVLADMEWRFTLFLEDATGGRMSKPYYDIEVMRAGLREATDAIYKDGWDDALSDVSASL